MADRISELSLVQRAAQELSGGQLVALGPGLPTQIPGVLPRQGAIWFLADSGALGYVTQGTDEAPASSVDSDGRPVALGPGGTVLSLVDAAGMARSGRVDVAVIQTAQVNSRGDFTHWTTAATPGQFIPATAVDLAAGPKKVIAVMPHTSPEGKPNLVADLEFPVDGVGSVSTIITDVAVLNVTHRGLMLMEMAPDWRMDDVQAISGVPLMPPPDMGEMTFSITPARSPSKVFQNGVDALFDLKDGATVLIDGFAGPGGMPHYMLVSLREQGSKELTMISNTAGIARIVNFGTPPGMTAIDHSILIENKQIRKVIASYPVSPRASKPSAFELAYRRGEVELELVPQGTLAERLRAGGAGVAAFYTPTGVGTRIAQGKETRTINGKEYLLEQGLQADFCIIRGHKADTLGNVVYKGTSRNFNAVMAPAARVTIVEVDEVVEAGTLNPEEIVTPGVYISRIVVRPKEFSPYE